VECREIFKLENTLKTVEKIIAAIKKNPKNKGIYPVSF